VAGHYVGAAGSGPITRENNYATALKFLPPATNARVVVGVANQTLANMVAADEPPVTYQFLIWAYGHTRKLSQTTNIAIPTNSLGATPKADTAYVVAVTCEDDGDGVTSGETTIGVNNHISMVVNHLVLCPSGEILRVLSKSFEAYGTAVTVADGGDGIDASQTTIGVSSTTQIAAGHSVRIDSEYILVGGISGSNLTGCTRGYNSTTAATHAEGNAVQRNMITATRSVTATAAASIAEAASLIQWGGGVSYTNVASPVADVYAVNDVIALGSLQHHERAQITAIDTTDKVLTLTRGYDGSVAKALAT
jgi:hypothetical protein